MKPRGSIDNAPPLHFDHCLLLTVVANSVASKVSRDSKARLHGDKSGTALTPAGAGGETTEKFAVTLAAAVTLFNVQFAPEQAPLHPVKT